MNYNELTQKATALSKEGCEVKFYEMVLSYGLLNLVEEDFEAELITEKHFNDLLNIMVDYLSECYRVAPWDVADALTVLINDKGVEAVIEDYNNCGTMLEDQLCNM